MNISKRLFNILTLSLLFFCSSSNRPMELETIKLEQGPVPTLKALCINAYLKDKQKNDQAKLPDNINRWIILYGPLRQETLNEQLHCFIELNDSKKIEEVLQHIPKREVTALEKIGDFSKGYIRIWTRAYKSRQRAQETYNEWIRDTVSKLNQDNLSQTHGLQPIIRQEQSNYTEQRMKLFFCGRYSFWICCGGLCLSGLGAFMGSAFLLNE